MNTSLDKISILGAGWLGWPLAKKLVEQGYHINGSTTHEAKLQKLSSDGIHPFLIQLTPDGPKGNDWSEFLKADLLIINIPPGRRDPDVKTNFPKKIKSLIEKIPDRTISKLLFVSSTGVFSDQQGRVTEDTRPIPTTDSGCALMEIEEYLKNENNFTTTILRPGGLFGGDRNPGRFLAGKKEIPNGNAPVNMIHQEDVVGIILAIIEQDEFGKTFHAVAPQHPARQIFYTKAAEEQGFKIPEFLENDGDGPFKEILSEKTIETLNYTFQKKI